MGDVVTQGLFLFSYGAVVMATYDYMEDYMIINELIRKQMMRHERTITDVADATGYTVERIKEIVLYDSSPTAIEAEIIFQMFGVNIAEIISY